MPTSRTYLPIAMWCGKISEILQNKVDQTVISHMDARCASALSSLAYTAPEMYDRYESEHKTRIFEFLRGRSYTAAVRNQLNEFFCKYT